MARMAYLRLRGSRQGEIRGGVVQKGREGRIGVIESNHELTYPVDAATGQAAGRLQHQAFVVVKEIDQATPRLYQALVDGEEFTDFELQYWAAGKAGAAGAAGAEVQRYTVRLTRARLRGIRFVHPDVLDPALKDFPEAEELRFTYERIEWQWVSPPSSAALDWQPRRGGVGTPAKKAPARKTPARKTAAAKAAAGTSRDRQKPIG